VINEVAREKRNMKRGRSMPKIVVFFLIIGVDFQGQKKTGGLWIGPPV